ncbi:U-box domain-containing protein 45-like [Bidens hawaiensis]|uniref:U-box domain-containing protein 45-like n=1 Tax=Bidens hawaiensis TaxID=980011 RepID=UPI004049D9CB
MVEEQSDEPRPLQFSYNNNHNNNNNKQTLIDQISGNLIHAGDMNTKIHAARDIRSLIRNNNNNNNNIRAKFGEAGVIQPLVLMLCSRNHDARQASLLAVLNLASRNQRNKEQIVTCGAIPSLVDLLNSHNNTTFRELATAAILTLSTAQSNKQTIISSGVIPLLVQILSCGTVQGRVDAVTALYNLTTSNSKQQPTITPDAKAIPPLINLLKECKKSSKFAEKSTFLIKIVLETEEGRSTIAKTVDGILTLVETVEDGSLISTEHAVSSLLTLCSSCRSKYRELILNQGAIPGLLRLTAYGTDHGRDMARTLLDLLRDSPPEKKPGSMAVEKMVYDIAVKVDGSKKAANCLLQDLAQKPT